MRQIVLLAKCVAVIMLLLCRPVAQAYADCGVLKLPEDANTVVRGKTRTGSGIAISNAGDVNGDGIPDLVVGALGNSKEAGGAYVIFQKASTDTVDLASLGDGGFEIKSAGDFDQTGSSVSGAGDVNGDGLADVIIGAAKLGFFDGKGAAYVVFGKASHAAVDLGALGDGGFRISGVASGDHAGWPVSGAGDVNGDGKADVVIGASGADNNSRELSGSAYVVFGKSSSSPVDLGSLGNAGFRIDGEGAGDAAHVVSGVGDVNGDGNADVIVGAGGSYLSERPYSAAAYVVFGKATSANVDLASLGNGGFKVEGIPDSVVGLSGAADVNGDGLKDFVIGSPYESNKGDLTGGAYVIFGKDSTEPIHASSLGSHGFRIDGAAAGDVAGYPVSGAGDVNGDGYGDILLGAHGSDTASNGASYVVYGSPSNGTVDLSVLGERGFRIDLPPVTDGIVGVTSVTDAGDVDGDGRADVAIGIPYFSMGGRVMGGVAYLLFATAAAPPAGCGDGAITGNEECDDGNQCGGDGCSRRCICEPIPGGTISKIPASQQRSNAAAAMRAPNFDPEIGPSIGTVRGRVTTFSFAPYPPLGVVTHEAFIPMAKVDGINDVAVNAAKYKLDELFGEKIAGILAELGIGFLTDHIFDVLKLSLNGNDRDHDPNFSPGHCKASVVLDFEHGRGWIMMNYTTAIAEVDVPPLGPTVHLFDVSRTAIKARRRWKQGDWSWFWADWMDPNTFRLRYEVRLAVPGLAPPVLSSTAEATKGFLPAIDHQILINRTTGQVVFEGDTFPSTGTYRYKCSGHAATLDRQYATDPGALTIERSFTCDQPVGCSPPGS